MYAPCDQSRNKNIEPNKYSGKIKTQDEHLVNKTTAYRKTNLQTKGRNSLMGVVQKRLELSCVTEFGSDTDGSRDDQTKLSKSDRDKYHVVPHTWTLK